MAGIRSIVLGQHATNHVLIELQAKNKAKLLGNPAAAPARVESLGLDNGRDQFR